MGCQLGGSSRVGVDLLISGWLPTSWLAGLTTLLVAVDLLPFGHLILPKKSPKPAKNEVYTQKTENRPTYGDFDFRAPRPPTSPNF